MKQYILNDVIELTNIFKKALKDKKSHKKFKYNKKSLYDCYRSLDIAIIKGKQFISSHFSMDINTDTFQETTNFLSPEIKWIYFVSEDLKSFDDALSTFIKSINGLHFEKNNKYVKIIKAYQYGWFDGQKKLIINDSGKELEYKYIPFNKDLPKTPPSIRERKEFYNTITIDIDSVDSIKKVIKDIDNKLNELIEFKMYLVKYMMKNTTIEDLLI